MDGEIEIGFHVYLIPRPATAAYPAPLNREETLRRLWDAKAKPATMDAVRRALPQPTVHWTDDQVLETVATEVMQGRMMLQVRTGICSENKRRFFNWLDKPLGKMAKDLKVPKQIILALAVKEGGWDKKGLDHNIPLNNPFGLNHINKQGQASGNKNYATVEECIEDWKSGAKPPRDYVRGVTDAGKFVDALLDHGYNTNKVSYRAVFLEDYKYVGLAMDACGIDKEWPK